MVRRNNNLRYKHYATLMAENEEELKSLLRLKEAAEKVDLKFNVKKAKIMAVSPHHFTVKRRKK